jgi:uncharacterized phage protein gp47/JayE
MPSPNLKSYEPIHQQMINVMVSRTSLTDVTDSSVFKHLLAAPAREMDEIYFQMGLFPDLFSIDTASGDDLDRRAADIQPGLLVRTSATKSTGVVVFTRSGTVGDVSIPAGTVLKTPSGVKFITIIDGAITNGNSSSGSVSVLAQDAGTAGNVAALTITLFNSKPAGVDGVSNPSTLIGGLDTETDDAFRARLKAYVASLARCTPQALEFIATGVTATNGQRVAFAHVVEDAVDRGEVYLYLDDGSGTIETSTHVSTPENLTQGLGGPFGDGDSALGGEQFLRTNFKPLKVDLANVSASISLVSEGTGARGTLTYGVDFLLNDPAGEFKMTPALVAGEVIKATYTYYGGLIGEVQRIVDGDPEDRTNYPGWRAAGVRVHCLPPQILQQVVNANVLVAEGFVKGVPVSGGYTTGSVLAAVAEAISAYVNNLGISGDVLRSELITRIMEVPGVTNTTLNTPATDIIMLDNQLARITIANILLS